MLSDSMPAAAMELRLLPVEGDTYVANASLRLPQSAGDIDLICGRAASVRFDPEALLALRHDPDRYGACLAEMLFGQPLVREALLKARSQAEALGARLRLVLRLDPADPVLHGLAWETLADPAGGGPLFLGERVVLSRYLESADMSPLRPRPRAALRAVVAVAGPTDLERYGLGPIDPAAEAGRASQSLGAIPSRVLSRDCGAAPTLNLIAAALRDGPDILYLVCHGTSRTGQPLLWLEAEDGASDRVSGEAFARMIAGLERRPLLIVLASCQSAGEGADVLASLGPRLVAAGVPAVLAMQGRISAQTVALVLPTFFRELGRDGQIDRAASVARAAALGRPDWWLPVLFLRLHDGRIWADPRQPAADALDPLALRNRTRMLTKVRDFWVRGVLDATIGRSAVDLSMTLCYDALENPWSGVVDRGGLQRERQRLPARQIVSVFDEAQGELLILGRPGSGKTTLMLMLASALIERAEADISLPMPVVFNLSSWGERHGDLGDWLIEELYTRYDVPREMAQGWVHARQVLPLLDGLDEVRAELRTSCLKAINAFDRGDAMGDLVVCSRLDEYEQAGVPLSLEAAVEVLPLGESEVLAYLDRGGETLAQVRALFRRDPTFSALMETPLMLSVVSAAYGGDAHIPISISAAIWRQYIFGAYVRRMVERRGGDPRYAREDIMRWLGFLARAMQAHSQSTLLIERLQPGWLQRPHDMLRYRLAVRLLSGLGLALTSYMMVGIVADWPIALASGAAGLLLWSIGWGRLRPLALGIWYGLAVGAAVFLAAASTPAPIALGYRLSYAALAGAISGVGAFLPAQQSSFTLIECIPSLRWAWGRGLRAGLLAFLLSGAPASLLLLLLTRDWTIILASGAAVGMTTGSLAGLAVGMTARELEASARPNDGIRRSFRTALRVASIAGPLFSLVGALLGVALRNIAENLGLDLLPGLTNIGVIGLSGLVAGVLVSFLAFGGLAALQHFVLRLVMAQVGLAPWKIADFLDYCAERALLRKVGGGYIFIHRTLLEYFAEGPEL